MNQAKFPLTITRKKIKNMYLRVHPDGTVSVSAPKRVSDKIIRDFVNSKSDWIETQLKKLEERKQQRAAEPAHTAEPSYITGEIHYLWGHPCHLLVEETTGRSSVEIVETFACGETGAPEDSAETTPEVTNLTLCLRVPANTTPEQRRHLLEEFYRQQLKLVVPPLMEHYAHIVGKFPAEWRIRNMKTRWGTCNTKEKRIWLSLHLAKKHPDCLSYVIVHELTHLHVPNHSKAFWARMDVYYPRWKEVRQQLNE